MKFDLVKAIEEKELFSKQEKLIVTLSGGVDSMVLFDVVYKLNKNIIVAHVNHKAREISDQEFDTLKAFAKSKKVVFEGYVASRNESENFHQDSRNQRYNFFRAIAQKHQAKKILVAHHQDDQVETILMRLIRGTSFTGYAGIPGERKDRNISIIRPFMDIKKSTLVEYAKENEVPFYEDESNQEDYYTRNRFRNKIIPLLKEENPKLNERVAQFADYINSADSVLTKLRDQFLQEYCFYNTVSLEAFKKLDRAIMIKVIKHLVNTTTMDSVEVSYDQYNAIINMCFNDTPNNTYALGKGFEFVKEYESVYVQKEVEVEKINITVEKEGEYFVSDNKSYVFSTKKLEHNSTNYFELCYNDKVFPLYIRQRQNGDKMSLKVGTKKVKNIMIDQKVPLTKRDKILLIANDDFVLWIPGIKKSVQDQTLEQKLYVYEVE